MSLVKKKISHSSMITLQWLACSPIRIPCGVLGCLFFSIPENICFYIACGPCLDNTVNERADIVTRDVMSRLDFKGLDNYACDPDDDSTLTAILSESRPDLFQNNLYNIIHTAICKPITTIFDCYNLGSIKHKNLKDEQMEYIANTLAQAINAILPSKEDLDNYMHQSKGEVDQKRINSYLTKSILKIVAGDFIKNQLDMISTSMNQQSNDSTQTISFFGEKSSKQTSLTSHPLNGSNLSFNESRL